MYKKSRSNMGNETRNEGIVMKVTLTERQQREREFYNKYVEINNPINKSVNLAPVLSEKEKRPWNSYWAIFDFAKKEFAKDAVVLDFGTGPGENALKLAYIGYQVEGIDISDKNIEAAQKLFEDHQMEGHFNVGSVENLHHVDIEQGLKECYRVLKTGGKAYFREPVEVPFLDWIRERKIVKHFFPKETSFELHITEDERKLNNFDDRLIKSIFPKTNKYYYSLFSRFDKFYRNPSDENPSLLEKIDYILVKAFPFFKKLCGAVIYELEK